MDDTSQVQRTISMYSQAASQKDWDAAADTYHPDGVWAVPHIGMRWQGRETIKSGLIELSAVMEYVLQLNTPAVIDIDGDNASAKSLIHEFGKLVDRDESFQYMGLYADTLVRTDNGWKFAERVFVHCGTNGSPLLTGHRAG